MERYKRKYAVKTKTNLKIIYVILLLILIILLFLKHETFEMDGKYLCSRDGHALFFFHSSLSLFHLLRAALPLLLLCYFSKILVYNLFPYSLLQYCCKRAYGLGSQCRPNECLFGSGKPQGVRISGRGPDGQVREIQGSVYEQPN